MNTRFAYVGLVVAMLLVCAARLQAVPFDPTQPIQGPEAKAMEYLRADKADRAVELLKAELAKKPDSARLHYVLGLAYRQSQKLDLAETEFRTVLRQDPAFSEAHLQLAALAASKVSNEKSKAENLTLIEAAVTELRAAIQKNPHQVQPYYDLAQILADSSGFRDKDPESGFAEALKVLEEARKRAPEEVRPLVALGNVYSRQADFVASGRPFAELSPDVAKRCTDLLDKAIDAYRRSLALDARSLGSLERIAAIMSARGETAKAVKTIEEHLSKLENPMDQATCYRLMGQHLMQANELSDAESKLTTAIKTEPREMASYLLLANVQLRREMRDQAIATLKKSLEINANFLNAHIELGMLERQQNPAQAAEHFKEALNIAPRRATIVSAGIQAPVRLLADLYAVAAVQLGGIYIADSKFDEAVVVFRRLASILPNSPLPDFHIGEVYRAKDEPKVAREHYLNALRRDGRFVQARLRLGELEAAEVPFASDAEERAATLKRAIGHYELALQIAENNARILDTLAGLRAALAACSKPADRAVLEQALTDSKKAVAAASDAIGFRHRLATIYHELGKNKEAVDELKAVIEATAKAVEKEPENLQLLFLLADVRGRLNSWQPDPAVLKQALDGFSSIIEKQPRFLDAYLRAAITLEDAKDYARAAEWFVKLLDVARGGKSIGALSPEESRFALHAAAELAWLYCEYLNKLDDARKYARIAQEIKPDLPSLIDTIGWIHYKAGEYAEAVVQLRRAYQAAPDNATIAYHLGAALLKHENPQRAKEVLQEALKNVGNDAELKSKVEGLLKTIK